MVGAPARLSARGAGALVLAFACAVAAPAHGQGPERGWLISGQCREGVPQGGYQLRGADGRLRIQGAFNQGQRVGSFIFWSPAGVRVAHLPFDGDVLDGTVSLWYAELGDATEPARKLTAEYRRGERDGLTRSWYPDGRLRAEYEYAAGTLRSARAYAPTGAAFEEVQARAMAEQDRAADVEYVESLLATVRRHQPDCAPPPPQQPA
jgi:hypothetical protein